MINPYDTRIPEKLSYSILHHQKYCIAIDIVRGVCSSGERTGAAGCRPDRRPREKRGPLPVRPVRRSRDTALRAPHDRQLHRALLG